MKIILGSIAIFLLTICGHAQEIKKDFFKSNTKQLMKQLYVDFDLSTTTSSFAPRLDETKKFISDFYSKKAVKFTSKTITIEELDEETHKNSWYYQFKFIKKGDFNNDGIIDVLIEMTDKAISSGTYFTKSEMVLTKISEDSNIIEISSKAYDMSHLPKPALLKNHTLKF